eukprot:gene865-1687_t
MLQRSTTVRATNGSLREITKKRKSGDGSIDSENVDPFEQNLDTSKNPKHPTGSVSSYNSSVEELGHSPKRSKLGQTPTKSQSPKSVNSVERSRSIPLRIQQLANQNQIFSDSKKKLNDFTPSKNPPPKSPGIFAMFKSSPSQGSSSTMKSSEILSQAANSINIGLSRVTTVGSQLRYPTEVRANKRSIVNCPVGDQIRIFFERAFTINDDKLNEIVLSRLKPKTKWDFKDKSQKQAAVITDLRNAFNTLFDEIRVLKDNCLTTERSLNETITIGQQELQDHVNLKSAMRLNEIQLKKDLMRVTNELTKTSSALSVALKEEASLKAVLAESDEGKSLFKERLAAESALRLRAEAELEGLRNELIAVKRDAADNAKAIVVQCDQRLEVAVAGYREEAARARAELGRRQSESDRTFTEKIDVDKAAAVAREQILQVQSDLREAECNASRLQTEVRRLGTELEQVRNQLGEKEGDLRTSLASLSEVQKQSSEERTSLRKEISTAQEKLQGMEYEKHVLTSSLATAKDEVAVCGRDIAALRDLNTNLQHQLASSEANNETAKDAILQLVVERELRSRSEVREESERRERIAACAQLLATQTDCEYRIREIQTKLHGELEVLRLELQTCNESKRLYEDECRQQCDLVTGLTSEIRELKRALEHAEANHESAEQLGRVTGELEVLRRHLKTLNSTKAADEDAMAGRILHLEAQIQTGEIQRRKMHNLIQELRGNVRVFARVRPFLPNDAQASQEPSILVKSDGTSLRIADQKNDELAFSFDKVFGPSISQEVVFDEVSEFVQSALDGYNVCLFSYGQTGSGKTHTMQGSGAGPMRGIIPRAIQQVGMYKIEQERKGWEYHMEVSFIEIYNETIRDLLRQGGVEDCKHEIKKDAAGYSYVSDVAMVVVDPNDSVLIDQIMEQAARHRSVAQTAMNERSSRSHSIFTMHLRAAHAEQGLQMRGSLSLVDLAGSERLDRSGATGDRLKETAAINKSLSALTDVFLAIGNKQSHIPFRNSKLTYLLQPALSGDGKTLMMVNLSPTEESYFESLCSLRFASQVNQCELGKPKRNLKEAAPSASATDSSSSSASTVSPNKKKGMLPVPKAIPTKKRPV